MATFLDFYEEELRKRGLASSGKPQPPVKQSNELAPFVSRSQEEEEAKGVFSTSNPIGWTLDMLSRPLFGVTNAINKTAEQGATANKKFSEGDIGGGIAEVLGAALFTPARVLEGMTSNDPDDKRYNAQTIEHVTDTFGALDPNYKDEENNVNETVKGVAGFAGDVLLDPLTWLPGAQIAKAASLVGRGAKAATGAAAGAVKGLREGKLGEEAVEAAAQGVKPAKGAKPEALTDEQALAESMLTPAPVAAPARQVDETEDFLQQPGGWVDPELDAAKVADEPTPVDPGKGQTYLVKRMPKQPSAVDAILASAKTDEAAEIAAEAALTGKTLKDVIKESPRTAPMKSEVSEMLAALSGKASATPVAVKPTNAGLKTFIETNPEATLRNVQLPGDPVAQRYTMRQLATIASTDKGQRGKAALGLMKSTYERQLKADAATSVVTGVQAVQARLQRGETTMRNILGDDVFEQLSTLAASGKTQHALRSTLIKLDNVLGGRVDDLSTFAKGTSNQRLMANVESAYRTPFTEVKSAVKEPEQVAQLVEDISVSPVAKAFQDTLLEENIPGSAAFKAKYPGYARGNPVAKSDDGTADWWRLTNTFTQYGMYRRLQKYISDQIVKTKGVSRNDMEGAARAAANRQGIEALGSQVSDAMETFGTGLYLGISGDLTRLTFPQVYIEVGKAMDALVGPQVTNLALHNYGTSVAFTRLMNVVHEAVSNPAASVDEIAAYVRKKTLDSAGGNSKKKLDNHIIAQSTREGAKGVGMGYHFLPNAKKAAQALASQIGGSVRSSAKGHHVVISADNRLPELLAQAVVAARPALVETAERNAAEWAERGIAEAQKLAGSHLRKVTALASNDTKLVQRELALALARKEAQVAEEAAAIAATPEATRGAVLSLDAALPDEAVKEAKTVLTQERKLDEGADLEDAGSEAMQARVKDADELTDAEIAREMTANSPAAEAVITSKLDPETGGVEKFDIGERAALGIERATGAFLKPKEWFNRNFGLNHMADVQIKRGNAASRFVTDGITHPLRRLSQVADSATIGAGIKAIQQGTRLAPDSELAPVAAELEKIIGRLFDLDSSTQSAMGNIFTESGAKLNHINGVLRWALGGDTNIQLYRDLALSEAKQALPKGSRAQIKALTQENLREQWRQWDFGSDPTAALVSIGQAAAKVAEHQATVSSFIETGIKNGFVKQTKNGNVPAGFVKIVDTSGQSAFGALLPKNTYVAREFAQELHRLDVLTTTSRQLSGEAGDFTRKYLIPTTNLWKQGMTIYRPGHHVRNAIGNASIQYVSRGVRAWAASQKAALKLMAVRNDFEGMDALAALKSIGESSVPTGGDVLVRGFVKGKPVEITQDELWHVLNKEGLLPTYTASEGLLTDEVLNEGLVGRLHSAVDAEKHAVGRAAGALSQNIDHAQRIHHFMQALMQETSKHGSRWKNLPKEELYSKIADEVRKTHPDASMLTAFETKYMKLAIPFYSWLRGVLPGAIESAMMHPGRVMSLPKASYNAAIAAGINPETLTNPFPDDQLFPSFITESVFGPQMAVNGSYLRVNPGFAHIDIAETFGLGRENTAEGLMRGILGMTNPLFRVPAELASGGSWSTGGRIKDTSDYVDQSLPFVNYLSNLTGMSLTGSVAGLPTGGGLDEQAQVAAGNKGDLDKWLTGINWLTGLNVQNVSRPNYINYAEIEKRDAAGSK